MAMTRREFFLSIASAAGAGAVHAISQAPLIVPVHLVLDGQAKWRPEQVHYFWSHIWPEAVRDLASCGIRLPKQSANRGSLAALRQGTCSHRTRSWRDQLRDQ